MARPAHARAQGVPRPTSSSTAASSGTTPPGSSPTPAPGRCSARRAPATSRSPARSTGWPPCSATPADRGAAARPGRPRGVQLELQHATTAWRTGRWPRRCAPTSTDPRPGTRTLTSVSPFAYLERGRYAEHLAPWRDALPRPGTGAVPGGAARRARTGRRALRLAGGRRRTSGPTVAGRAGQRERRAAPTTRLDDELLAGCATTSRDSDQAPGRAARTRAARWPRTTTRGADVTDRPTIPFNRPEVDRARARLHARVDGERPHLRPADRSPSGPARSCRQETGAAEVLLTTSCTAALELSAMLLDLGPGDTVIVPSFTFTSSAWRSPGRAPGSCSATSSPRRSASTRAPRRAARRLGAGGRGRPLRRHRLRRRRASARCWRTGPTWRWSRTTPTASSAAGAASRSAASAGSPR